MSTAIRQNVVERVEAHPVAPAPSLRCRACGLCDGGVNCLGWCDCDTKPVAVVPTVDAERDEYEAHKDRERARRDALESDGRR